MKFKLQHIKYIGRVAVFYIPIIKLDVLLDDGQTARQILHDFCVSNYNAYTHESSKIQGFWMNKNILVRDEHEKFEVSFRGSKKVKGFVVFLSKICKLIQEESIYLTIGSKSWLVFPPNPEFESMHCASCSS